MNFKKNEKETNYFDDNKKKISQITFDNTNISNLKKSGLSEDKIISKIILNKNPNSENDFRYGNFLNISMHIIYCNDVNNNINRENYLDKENDMKTKIRNHNALMEGIPLTMQYSLSNSCMLIGLCTKDDVKEIFKRIQKKHKYLSDNFVEKISSLNIFRQPSKDEKNFLATFKKKIIALQDLLKKNESNKIEEIVNNLYTEASKIDKLDKLEGLLTFNLANTLSSIGLVGFATAIYLKINKKIFPAMYRKSCSKLGNILYEQSALEKDEFKSRELLKKAAIHFKGSENPDDNKLVLNILSKLGLSRDNINNLYKDPFQVVFGLADQCYDTGKKLEKTSKELEELKLKYKALELKYNKVITKKSKDKKDKYNKK